MRAQAMSYGRDSQGFIDCLERGMHDMREMLKGRRNRSADLWKSTLDLTHFFALLFVR